MSNLNTDIVLAIFVATIVLLLLSSFGIIFTVIYKKKQQAFALEKHMMEAHFKEELLKAELEIQEQAVKHLGSELHDNIGQIASVIKINLISLPLDDTEKAKTRIKETLDITRQMINDIKMLSVSLNGDRVAQLGLTSSIRNELERLQQTGQYKISFEVSADLSPIDGKTSVILFRMVQEILNNVISHSNASELTVRLYENENMLYLSCADNGKGFDVERKLKNGGSGLINLQNRAKLINGSVRFESIPGNGTTVIVNIQRS